MLAVFGLVAVSYVCDILYLVCSCNCDVQIKETKMGRGGEAKKPTKKKEKGKKKKKSIKKPNPKHPSHPPSPDTTKQSPLLQELVKTEANNAMI